MVSNPIRYRCPTCNRMFGSYHAVKDHIIVLHPRAPDNRQIPVELKPGSGRVRRAHRV